jgi:hypothetical protein
MLELPLLCVLQAAFDWRSSPGVPQPDVGHPGTDVDSVLEWKREQSRPAHDLPPWFTNLFPNLGARDGPSDPAYKSERRKDGSVVHEDARYGRFDATVRPDGTVEFTDHEVQRKSWRQAWHEWLRDPLHNAPPMPQLAFSFDLTDTFMRRHGQDPYRLVKSKFMDDTLAAREQDAATYRAETMAKALEELPGYLAALWGGPGSALEKLRTLYQLWDEVDTSTAGGRRAREIILEFLKSVVLGGDTN